MKKIISDFKKISWAKPITVISGIKDVIIFSILIGLVCGVVDIVTSLIMKVIGG